MKALTNLSGRGSDLSEQSSLNDSSMTNEIWQGKKEDKWGKKTQNKTLASAQGSFFEVSALGDKSLSHAQLSLTLLTAEPLQQISLSMNSCP